jgi:hypothetical protein
MRTPAGSECGYFYGDYYRGRNHEECRLLGNAWQRELCRTCPVPGIQRANACEHMQLRGETSRPLASAFRRRVKVTAYCQKTRRSGFDPHIGCGECHPLPGDFEVTPQS